MKRKIYRTSRLELRALTLKDYSAWKRAHEMLKPAIDKFDVSPWSREKLTKEDFKQLVLRQKNNEKKDSLYIWNVFTKKTGEFVGRIDIATIIREPYQMANLGYFIFNTHRGQGYAVEALKTLIRAGFKDLGFHRLEAAIDLDNKASLKLAKKIGMHREGVKKHYWFQNNRWEDQIVFIATPELFR